MSLFYMPMPLGTAKLPKIDNFCTEIDDFCTPHFNQSIFCKSRNKYFVGV